LDNNIIEQIEIDGIGVGHLVNLKWLGKKFVIFKMIIRSFI